MAASRELTLTEELFRATQLNKYKETIKPIMPGRGLPENLFEGSQHAANYVLDTHLTFKVNIWMLGTQVPVEKGISNWGTAANAFSRTQHGTVGKYY